MRKLFCLFFLFVTVFFSLPVYADSLVSSEELHFQCMNCSYTSSVGAVTWVNDNAKMTCPECGGRLGVFQGETFIAGGGVTRGSGVGRPEGYAGEGISNYSQSGDLQLAVYPQIGPNDSTLYNYPSSFNKTTGSGYYSVNGLGVNVNITTSISTGTISLASLYWRYTFVPPVSGLYYIASDQDYFTHYLSGSSYQNKTVKAGSFSRTCFEGQSTYFLSTYTTIDGCYGQPYTAYFHPVVLTVVPDTSTISNKTSITINDNSFNGNIYVDNSSNLTYIYPQYTTITEEGDTVTNISETVIVYNNTTNQYVTYDQTTNNYYYITTDGNPPVVPTPTPEPTATPTPSPNPYEPIGVGDTFSDDVVSGTSISGTVNAKAGDFVLATVSARSALTIPDTMAYLYKGSVFASNSNNQTMSFAYQQVSEDGTYTYTFSQASSGRMYLSLIVLSDIDGLRYSGNYHTEGNGISPYSVLDKTDGDMLVWGCSTPTWPDNNDGPGLDPWITSPSDLTYVGGSSNLQSPRQGNFIDLGSGACFRTFSVPSTSSSRFYVIDAVEIIPKIVEPDPTPTPDPGSDLEPTPTPAPGGGYDDTNLLDKLGLWFADVNLNLNLAIENLALNFCLPGCGRYPCCRFGSVVGCWKIPRCSSAVLMCIPTSLLQEVMFWMQKMIWVTV